MRDFKITITSEDLKDPAKLACVEAILKSEEIEGGVFVGITVTSFLIEAFGAFLDEHFKSITLLYSQIKLDPRKLIGEEVECVGNDYLGVITELDNCGEFWLYDAEDNDMEPFCRNQIKLSPTWLKQNFKCEEV